MVTRGLRASAHLLGHGLGDMLDDLNGYFVTDLFGNRSTNLDTKYKWIFCNQQLLSKYFLDLPSLGSFWAH